MRMAVIRVHKTANYTIMSNHHFKEKGMSLKAKGLLSLMLSLPDDWDYSINGLATLSKDGRDSVMSALQELEKFGYLMRTRVNDEKGRFAGFDYDIYEEPQKENADTEKPYTEKPNTDEPNTENPQQLNTKELNTDELISVNNKKLKDQDKDDKRDKSASASQLELASPNAFTKELISDGYIEEDDLYISDYNEFFYEMIEQYGFEVIRSCLWYFISQVKSRGYKDEFGNPIMSKITYLKTSIEQGAKRLEKTNEMYDRVRKVIEEDELNKSFEEMKNDPNVPDWLKD